MVNIHICIKDLILLSTWLVIVHGAAINLGDGAFNITGNGVAGQGSITLANGTAQVALRMVLGQVPQTQQVIIAQDKGVEVNSLKTAQSDHTETELTFTKEDEDFLDEMTEEHNKLRSIHLSPPLVKNRNMSLQAKALAIQLASEANLRHSDKVIRPDQGENLAMGCTSSGPGITAKDAAKEWYDEVCSHNFYNQAYQDKSGHFSQLVWNATRELGVGKAMGTKFGMNCTFIVARYRPLGNIGSEFAHDVTKGKFDSSYCSNVQRDVLPHHGDEKIETRTKQYRYRTKIPRFPKIVIL